MNSFTLTAVGNLAKNPELVAKGDTTYTRFCLIGNDYAGKDEDGAAREVTTSLWFVAFGALGEAIARNARKGDQLIIDARVRASNWTDQQGEQQYDYSFIVEGFRFGAPGKMKREELERSGEIERRRNGSRELTRHAAAEAPMRHDAQAALGCGRGSCALCVAAAASGAGAGTRRS